MELSLLMALSCYLTVLQVVQFISDNPNQICFDVVIISQE